MTKKVMDDNLKACLVRDAKKIVEENGIDTLVNHQHKFEACVCIGVQNGDPCCPCYMSFELNENLDEILSEIAKTNKERIRLLAMRQKVIDALKGDE